MAKLGDAFLAIIPEVDDGKMSSAMNSITGKLSGVASAGTQAFKVVGVAAATAATAIVASATKEWASYEQNVGGMKKLYGDAYQTMITQAQDAYATCGMSANQYMEQASSFSAALTTSLGGDVVKAAEQAEVAMEAMSDNVNTFGTDMTDVQNAFQGFAKQNYTMLDNLKLGYGGTKSEMERLIQDANEYAQANGQAADLSIDSFSDIVTAIELIQEKQNIAGTTSKEAATTIEGSVNQMKAAWTNWLTSLGDSDWDVSVTTQRLVESIEGAATQVIPRVGQIIATLIGEMPGLLASLGPTLATTLQGLFDSAAATVGASIPSQLQPIVDGFGAIGDAIASSGILDTVSNVLGGIAPVAAQAASSFGTLATNLSGPLQTAFAALSPVIQTVADAITLVVTNLDTIAPVVATVAAGFAAFSAVTGILTAVGTVISTVAPVVTTLGTAFGLVAEAVAAGTPLFSALAAGIGLVLSPATLVAAGIAAVSAVVVAFATNAGGCRDAVVGAFQAICDFIGTIGATIGGFLASALSVITGWVASTAASAAQAGSQFLSNVRSGFASVPGLVVGFLNSAISSIGSFVGSVGAKASAAGQSFLSGIRGGFNSAVSFVSSIPSKIVSALGSVGSLLVNAGKSIINGLLSGLKSAFSSVTSWVSGIADTIASLKGPLPYDRKVLIPNGMALMESLQTGLERGFPAVTDLVSGMADEIADAATMRVSASVSSVAGASASGGSTALTIVRWLDDNLGEIIGEYAPSTVIDNDAGALIVDNRLYQLQRKAAMNRG